MSGRKREAGDEQAGSPSTTPRTTRSQGGGFEIIIRGPASGETARLRVKPHSAFVRVADAWRNAKHPDTNVSRFRWVFEGKRINQQQTIDQLGIEEGDAIDVMVQGFNG
ncbi:hypothetical protein SeLEV6574_g04454 [Synchytrium endobioticum]|uniref:Ubiquitin-like domain-containing protein n=1 Tax=Synchytrium endobioticum TaxID=286115 RepID=A0A507CZE2_9FUNG|nr:hypothetical protein SeLEV6574_g04454 [Synchytrium endobioticum]